MLHALDRLFSWLLLGAAVIGFWLCAKIIHEQNRDAPEDEVKDEWRIVVEVLRYNWSQIRQRLSLKR
jgi:uncharacterized protein YneF (UPF0154 family)